MANETSRCDPANPLIEGGCAMTGSVTKQGSVVDNLQVADDQVDHLLGDEYEHESVPMTARRSAFSVTLVWLGFPLFITGAMTGSILIICMGFSGGLNET